MSLSTPQIGITDDNSPRRSTMADSSERKSHKVIPTRVKSGDLMAFVYYVKVKQVDPAVPSLVVEDLDHDRDEFDVSGTRLIASAFSADQFQEEEKVTMTRAAEILIASYNRPLTVCFVKQSGWPAGDARQASEARAAPGTQPCRGPRCPRPEPTSPRRSQDDQVPDRRWGQVRRKAEMTKAVSGLVPVFVQKACANR
jgi:hypothetical protein